MPLKNLIFVDCEAWGPCPEVGELTEFGAVDFTTDDTFHGRIWAHGGPDPQNPAQSLAPTELIEPAKDVFASFAVWLRARTTHRAIMVSDNPAFDFQWVNHGFWVNMIPNPFGHSARRISDFYAGLRGDFAQSQGWKKLRVTPHDHNPVHDAQGNVEAFRRILAGER